MNAPQIIRRESHTEKLVFTSKPDRTMRATLKAAGFRWNGVAWWRNVNSTTAHKVKEFSALVAANDNTPQPEAASA